MPFPVKSNVADELIAADMFESWSIEELRRSIEEIDAELRQRQAPPRGALRSRRSNASRRPRRRTDGARC
jgi:hypothetical protein